MDMTLGQGQWPRIIGKTGWINVHFFWRRVYEEWKLNYLFLGKTLWSQPALNVYVGMRHFHGNDIYYIPFDDIPTKLPFTLLHKPYIFLMSTPELYVMQFPRDITCLLITCISNFLRDDHGQWVTDYYKSQSHLLSPSKETQHFRSSRDPKNMLRLTFRMHAWLLREGRIGRMNKMTKDNCRIGYPKSLAWILKVLLCCKFNSMNRRKYKQWCSFVSWKSHTGLFVIPRAAWEGYTIPCPMVARIGLCNRDT